VHSEEDVRQLRAALRSLQRRLRSERPPVLELSRPAMQVLIAIDRSPGASAGAVADELRMTSSNVAAGLRELTGAALVERAKDPDDSRRVRLTATATGEAAVATLRSERDTWLGRAIDEVLDEAEQQALFAAGRLVQRLAEYEERR
jgi:DNA-binding MarR family transcriptional regulator